MKTGERGDNDFISLGDAIKKMLHQYHLDDKFKERELIEAWPSIVGKSAASNTSRIYIKNHVLFVEVSSASLKHELSLNKEMIVQRIKDDFGPDLVREIIIM